MNHAITIGDLVWPALMIGGFAALVFLIFFLIWLFNPFRTGH